MDLGETILSIALAAGFVAFGALILRLLVNGIKQIASKFYDGSSIEVDSNKKGFQKKSE